MQLARLIFLSKFKAKLTYEERCDLMDKIKQTSKNQNKGTLMTGVLMSIDRYFIEALEAPRVHLSKILRQVMNHEAHEDLVIVDYSIIPERSYREFPKHGCVVFRSEDELLRKFIVDEEFNPYQLSVDAVVHLTLEALNTINAKSAKYDTPRSARVQRAASADKTATAKQAAESDKTPDNAANKTAERKTLVVNDRFSQNA